MVRLLILFFLSNLAVCSLYAADPQDPFDPFRFDSFDSEATPDDQKSVTDLIAEATMLFAEERPLDGRTKLIKALQKEPSNYEIHLMLGGYYLIHVGHFRLALKYIKQAENLFSQQNGPPPYSDEGKRNDHARILYLLAEIRLNLDNYKGALEELDNFSSYGYYGQWLPGSKAWVLMKLGRLDDAVRTARLGILAGAEPGRTLNILGILLSMTGQRQESLEIFNHAIVYELSQGKSGQPATPLNNSGEVYREIFQEDRAEASWLKALSFPDGCEHVLPSLNLTTLYNEQLRFERAKETMDNFERCVAQFPLRNGEEHRALVHLARGRIALHTGHVDSAIKHFEETLERRQWFGKIGTNEEDLSAGVMSSLAQALRAKNNLLDFTPADSLSAWVGQQKEKLINAARIWWLHRRARQILAGSLNNFEDLYLRHTDSMLEYHTLGENLATFPSSLLRSRVEQEAKNDDRLGAQAYYKAYLAESALKAGRSEGKELLDTALKAARVDEDAGLRLHLLFLKLSQLEPGTAEYNSIASEAYRLAPGELRNFGGYLPVSMQLSSEATDVLSNVGFLQTTTSPQFSLRELSVSQGVGFELVSLDGKIRHRGEGKDLDEAVKNLVYESFTEKVE